MTLVAGLLGGLMLVLGLGQGTARAAYPACDWTWSGGSGEWNDPAHWTKSDGTHGTPSRGGGIDGNVACITAPGTYTVSSRYRGPNADQDGSDALILGNPTGVQTVQIVGSSGADARLSTGGVFNGTALINPTGRVILTSAGSAGAATLNYNVINHGVVSSEVGAGGARTLPGSMNNSGDGQLQINTDTNTPSEQWVNTGTIAVAAGKTFTDNAGHGSFDQNGGTMALTGDFRLTAGSFNHNGGDITGSPVQICTSEALRPRGPGTAGFVIPAGCIYSPSIRSDVGANDTVTLSGASQSTNFVAPSTNRGAIVMDGAGSDMLSGSLINEGTVRIQPGGARAFDADLNNTTGTVQINADTTSSGQWVNTGTIAVAAGKTFTDNPGHGSFDQNGGTMALTGDFRLTAGSFNHNGGDITGSPVQLCNGEALRPRGPGTAGFVVPAGCPGPYITSDVGANDTVTLSGGATVASSITNRGAIVMDGAGSPTLSGSLINEGTVRIQPGGPRAFDADLNNTTGTVQINADTTSAKGGTLANSGTFSVASGKTFTTYRSLTQSGGTLALAGTLALGPDYGPTFTDTGGAVQLASTGRLSPAYPFRVQGGTLSGSGTVTQSVTNTGGTVSPGSGASTGVLSIAGDYTQGSGGALAVKVNGPGAGAGFDQLSVTGAANLGGALNVTTTGAQSGDFRVVSSGSRIGAFATTNFTGQTPTVTPDATGAVLSYQNSSIKPPPTNISPPTITGTATQGQTLTEHNGTWTNSPTSFAYQWQDCDSAGNSCAAIAGATGQSYALTASDVGHTLRVQETATNTGGTGGPVASDATAVVQASAAPPTAPASTGAPPIVGSPAVGMTLRCQNGSWSGTMPQTYAYQFLRNGTAIAGATGAPYTIASADAGHALSCRVTASNSAGSASATSASVSVPAKPSKFGIATVGHASVKGTSARARVTCKGVTGQICTVTLTVTIRETLKHGKVTALSASKRTVVVGTTTVTLGAGQSKVVRVQLNRTGQKLLAGRHKLSATLKASQRTSRGSSAVGASQTVTFKTAGKTKKRG